MYFPLHSPNSQAECQNPRESLGFHFLLCMLPAVPTPTFSLPYSGTTGPLDGGFTHFSQYPRARSLSVLNCTFRFCIRALWRCGTCWDSFRKPLIASFRCCCCCSRNQPRGLSCSTCRNECLFLGPSRCQG